MMNIYVTAVKKGVRTLNKDIRGQRARNLVERGRHALNENDTREAIMLSRKALEIDRHCNPAYALIADALMPGESYGPMLSHFHEHIEPAGYLEIGVNKGRSLARASDSTKSIGIDPEPAIKSKLGRNKKLYPITSDQFFASYDLFEELEGRSLDLAFIDGMHTFRQTLRDFINVEKNSSRATVVLVHDCMPIDKKIASYDRRTQFWSGDVWKIVPCLMKYRPDLNTCIIPTSPAGLGVISNLDPSSTVLDDRFQEIVSEYQHQELPYSELNVGDYVICGMYPKVLGNDWSMVTEALSLRKRGYGHEPV
jgi:hypothetical protein